ncbi:MAG: type II toxin-antitoxin system RatA family toxin [Pseudomonadota bacterium]
MVRVERSALMAFESWQLLALVQDVARYPEFMPGCIAATVTPMDGERVQAGLRFRFAGLSESFLTENVTTPMHEGSTGLKMQLLQGPFKSLVGEWRFQSLGQGACKVSLTVELDWGVLSLGRLLGPQLDRAISTVMQAFKQRASQLYA